MRNLKPKKRIQGPSQLECSEVSKQMHKDELLKISKCWLIFATSLNYTNKLSLTVLI